MKYSINICLGAHVWSKPITVSKRYWLNAYDELFEQLEEHIRIEEDENWKLTYHIFYATGKTDARVIFCKEECKKEV